MYKVVVDNLLIVVHVHKLLLLMQENSKYSPKLKYLNGHNGFPSLEEVSIGVVAKIVSNVK